MNALAADAMAYLSDASTVPAANDKVAALNREVARDFLDMIEPGGEFLFTLKPDPSGAGWPKGCPAHIHGTIDTVWPYVERFNNETDRVGVFVTINRHPRITDDKGKLRRGGAHVTAVRAVFIDVDDPGSIPGVEEVLRQGPAPNATVFTARGRHYYWLIDGLAPDRFKSIQGSMAVRFSSDRSVTDAARIMRVPGTRHVKACSVAVGCEIAHRNRLNADEFASRLDLYLGEMRSDREAAPVEPFPAEFGFLSSHFVDAAAWKNEFTGGIVEGKIADARNARLALANAGRLVGRDAWRDLILFPFAALAHESPEHEDAIRAAFDEVSAASAAMGANVAANEAQWEAQMRTAPREGGRSLASTFTAAGEVNVGLQDIGVATNTLSSATSVAAMPASIQATSFDRSRLEPDSSRLALSGTVVPMPKPRPLNLAAPPPHRQWVLGKRLLKGETTVLAAPGGRAKSSIAVAWACSLACGRNLIGEWVYGGPKRVLYISTEDDAQELDRRFHAAMMANALTPADLANIEVLGVDTVRITLTAASDGSPTLHPAGLAALRQYIEAARADVVVLDPLSSVVPVGLNDNGLIAGLMAQLKALAVERDFALLIIHHFKKGADGSAEGVGGASAIVNHARAVFTVEAMGEREAASFGIMPSERWRLLRLADLKLNLAPRADATDWLYLGSVTLPNAAPPDYPDGGSVQAVTSFTPPPIGAAGAGRLVAEDTTRIEVEFIRKVREAQNANRAFYVTKQGAKSAGVPSAIAALADIVRGVTGRSPLDCDALAEPMLADLMARGIVAEAQIATPTRHKRRGLVVGPNASGWG